jgi:small-conductance mechanosensitive channel
VPSSHRVLVNLWKPFLVLVGGLFVLRYLKRGLYQALVLRQRNSLFSAGTLHAIGRYVTVLLYVLLVLAALRIAGFPVSGVLDTFTGFLAVLGVGLVAVGTILGNITATFFMWIWRPYQLGQPIKVLPDGIEGKVRDSPLMDIEVEEPHGRTVLIPNNLFFQKYVRRLPLPVQSTVRLPARLRAGVVGGEDEDGPRAPGPVVRD